MKDNVPHIAITGLGGLDNPEPGTPVARALRRGWPGGVRIEALGYSAWETGAWSPGVVDGISVVPALSNGDEKVLQRIIEVGHDRKIDVLIPCLDLEVPFYQRVAHKLRDAGIETLLPSASSLGAVVKTSLAAFCHRHDIGAPKTIHVTEISDVPVQADQFGYPLMVKGTVADAHKVSNSNQALAYACKLDEKWGDGVLLQQHIQGEEYCVAMVARSDGSCLGMVPMRKLGINHRGKGVVGAVVNDPALEREASRILELLDWCGPVELEFIKSASSGRFLLVEINCRFPSWILLSHWAGCNLPVAMVQEMLSPGTHRCGAPHPGTAYVRDVNEFSVPLARVEHLRRHRSQAEMGPGAGHGANIKRNAGLRIGITGVSAFNVVQPGIGVARSLKDNPEVSQLIGIGYGAYDTGIFRTELFDEIHTLPDTVDAHSVAAEMERVKKEAGLDVLVPSLDFEIPALAENADAFRRAGLAILVPSPESVRRCGKQHLASGDLKPDWTGFRIPESALVKSLAELEKAVDEIGFPLVVKGTVSGADIVHSMEDAKASWRAFSDKGREECIVQRFIRGEEFAIAAVCDTDHCLAGSFPIKKLLTCEYGNTWGAISIDPPELVSALGELTGALQYTGPIEAEFIRDAVTDKFFLIELNVRFPAWIGYAAECGVNLPLLAICLAADLPTPRFKTNGATVFMRHSEELRIDPASLASLLTHGHLKVEHAEAI